MKRLFSFFGIPFFAALLFTACVGNQPTVSVQRIALNRGTMAVSIGGSEALIITITPANATNQHITWTSSNPTIATVDENGLVTGVSLGVAMITATSEDGNFEVTNRAQVVQFSDALEGIYFRGLRWATRNVGAPGTFVDAPTDAGMFYQWNRGVGWSSTNPLVNSNGGTTWDSSIPTGTAWYAENDPCPAGWRVPTEAELDDMRSPGSIAMTYNGVSGRLFGIAPDIFFFPAAGSRYHSDGSFRGVDTVVNYWSSVSIDDDSAWDFWSNRGGVAIGGTYFRASALPVRCVAVD